MTPLQAKEGHSVLHSFAECQQLRKAWDEIVALQCGTVEQLDATAGFDWAMALWEDHLHAADQEVVLSREGSEIAGILPLYRLQKTIRGVPCRSVAPLTELYAGRTGFLLRKPGLANLEALFAGLSELRGAWDTLLVTVVEGSRYEELLLELASRKNLHWLVLGKERSPYIPFQDSWEQHFASLPKKLRSTMRNGEKRLRDKGGLSYQECRSTDEAKQFNAAVEAIEQDSWKAAAGTSIASNPVHQAFHVNLALRAAAEGRFSGHLLFLDGQPIAYIMGLLYGSVFLDLKESYRVSFREMSPGHVLKSFAFARLYEHGTRLYDFMGKCEEYKLKWTDKTYCRSTYVVFNNTLRSRFVRVMDKLFKRPAGGAPSSNGDGARNKDVAEAAVP